MKKFEINYKARKELFSEYDKIRALTRRSSLILAALGAATAFILYPVLIYLNPFKDVNLVAFIIGVLLIALALWGGKIFVFSKGVQKTSLVAGKQVFNENGMAFTPKLDNSNAEYSDYEKIIESDNAFYLLRKAAPMQIVGKEDFSVGAPEEFSSFIQEKTGKQIKKVSIKKKTVLAVVSSLVAFILAAGVIVGGQFIENAMKDQKKLFSVENYSIILTKEFEKVEIEGTEFHADSLISATEIDAAFYSNEYLKDEQDITLNNVEEFISWYFKDIVTEKKEVTEASATDNTIEYEVAAPNGSYYYLSRVTQTDAGFWFTECHTDGSLKADYQEKFAAWLDSVEAK